jgi:transcriptional regulator with XRE-family HTH domain
MSEDKPGSLLEQLARLGGQMAGQTLDAAKTTATLTAMFGESWLKSVVLKTLEPERLEAMADAGHFLRDARETAGLSLKELSETLELSDDSLLDDVESGRRIMPIEIIFRSASLIARHDPIPFLIKFMRTYNPSLGATLEQWGMMALPVQFERERRWINIYRQHDSLRALGDDEYDRLISYVDSATSLVLDVMHNEKAANSSNSKNDSSAKASTRAEPTASAATKKNRVEVEAVSAPKPRTKPKRKSTRRTATKKN